MFNHPAPRPHDSFSKLVFELAKLPGIGEKTAARLAYFILKQHADDSRALADAIVDAKSKTRLCCICHTFSEQNPCKICSNPTRDHGLVCVVERSADVYSVEQAGVFRGIYHVLHGVLSPLDGIGPDELRINELLTRLTNSANAAGGSVHSDSDSISTTDVNSSEASFLSSPIHEVILATNPSIEGEATALYLARVVKPFGVRLTQLAHGLPFGGNLEYADKQTINKALLNRMEMR